MPHCAVQKWMNEDVTTIIQKKKKWQKWLHKKHLLLVHSPATPAGADINLVLQVLSSDSTCKTKLLPAHPAGVAGGHLDVTDCPGGRI